MTRDESRDRIQVVATGRDMDWCEISIRPAVDLSFNVNGGAFQVALGAQSTAFEPAPVAAGNYVQLCASAGATTTVLVEMTVHGERFFQTTFASLAAC